MTTDPAVTAAAEDERSARRLRSLAEDMGLGPIDDRDLDALWPLMRKWVGEHASLRTRIAAEIEALTPPTYGTNQGQIGYRVARDDAARIARGQA